MPWSLDLLVFKVQLSGYSSPLGSEMAGPNAHGTLIWPSAVGSLHEIRLDMVCYAYYMPTQDKLFCLAGKGVTMFHLLFP